MGDSFNFDRFVPNGQSFINLVGDGIIPDGLKPSIGRSSSDNPHNTGYPGCTIHPIKSF